VNRSAAAQSCVVTLKQLKTPVSATVRFYFVEIPPHYHKKVIFQQAAKAISPADTAARKAACRRRTGSR
jgi:hypothetical protein